MLFLIMRSHANRMTATMSIANPTTENHAGSACKDMNMAVRSSYLAPKRLQRAILWRNRTDTSTRDTKVGGDLIAGVIPVSA